MKKILLLTGALTLLATTGCLISEGGGHGHHHGHGGVLVQPAVVVPVPAIIVR